MSCLSSGRPTSIAEVGATDENDRKVAGLPERIRRVSDALVRTARRRPSGEATRAGRATNRRLMREGLGDRRSSPAESLPPPLDQTAAILSREQFASSVDPLACGAETRFRALFGGSSFGFRTAARGLADRIRGGAPAVVFRSSRSKIHARDRPRPAWRGESRAAARTDRTPRRRGSGRAPAATENRIANLPRLGRGSGGSSREDGIR